MPIDDDIRKGQKVLEKIFARAGKVADSIATLDDILLALASIEETIEEQKPEITNTANTYLTTYKTPQESLFTDREVLIAGRIIKVAYTEKYTPFNEYKDTDSYASATDFGFSIKLDSPENPSIPLMVGTEIKTSGFKKFYISKNTSFQESFCLHIMQEDIVSYNKFHYPFAYNDGLGNITNRPAELDANGYIRTVINGGTLPAGDNNIGNVDVITLPSIPAGDNNIGNVDIASALPAGDNNIGNVDIASALPSGSNEIGIVTESIQNKTGIYKAYTWSTAVTGGSIWTPASGKKFCITGLICSVDGATTVTIFDNTDSGNNVIAKVNLVASGGFVREYVKPRLSATANNVLKLTSTNAVNGYITVEGYEV